MFLKRVRPNKRVLFTKYFIDPRASILIKKKLRNRSTQRFLQFFSRYIIAYSSLRFDRAGWGRFRRRSFKLSKKRRKGGNQQTKSGKLKNKLTRIPSKKGGGVKFPTDSSNPVKKFILSRMQFYSCYRGVINNNFILIWKKRAKEIMPIFLRKKWKRRQIPYPGKFFWLKRRKNYVITQLMDLIFQQYHYGFGSFTSFKCYLKKYAGREYMWKNTLSMGIEGMLANQLTRVLGIVSIRGAYLLVRSGAITVNKIKRTNPRFMLYVGDTFRILYPFSKILLKRYLIWLKKRRYMFNTPQYLEVNYKILAVKIWRKPTKTERKLINYYPFFKNELTSDAAKYYKWITE